MNIYLYHLTQNGQIRYVGVTTYITQRKSEHKKNRPPHTFEIIDTFTDKEEAGIAEQYHIAGHNTFKEGWNKSIGGEMLLTGENHPAWKGGFDKKKWMKAYNKERSQRPEVKARRKELRGRATPEVKAKIKEYDRAYHQTPKAKAKKKESNRKYREKNRAIT